MTIAIDTEKASDKFQHGFMIKTLNKLEIEGDSTTLERASKLRNKFNIKSIK